MPDVHGSYEAPAIFKKNGVYFLFASQLSGESRDLIVNLPDYADVLSYMPLVL